MTPEPVHPTDPVNMAILSVAEDCIEGFHRNPFSKIAEKSGVPVETVISRLKAMLAHGVVRRVRQTLLATRLAQGALVAWDVPEELLEQAFEWLRDNDPFTGHVVLRSTNPGNPGSEFRLWTTLKVPSGSGSLDSHCSLLASKTGARRYVLLPTRGVFALGVGHMRRRFLKPGDQQPAPATMQKTGMAELEPEEWAVLLKLKEELTPGEFNEDPWKSRAQSLGMEIEEFCSIAERLNEKNVIGRFATFLEHVKQKAQDGPVTRHNGLFHWAVPKGMEERAGGECGRHICMTHCYWRDGGECFGGAQIMGVVHGLEKKDVLAHKAAIDAHLEQCGIPVLHTAVFWGERSEIKPSEISPEIYRAWLDEMGAPSASSVPS